MKAVISVLRSVANEELVLFGSLFVLVSGIHQARLMAPPLDSQRREPPKAKVQRMLKSSLGVTESLLFWILSYFTRFS